MHARQAQELEYSPPTASRTNLLLRFAGNLLSSFFSPREANAENPHPGLLELLSILENAYDREFSEELTNVTLLVALWRCTTNIVLWSQVIWWRKKIFTAGDLTYLAGPRLIQVQAPPKM